MKLFLANLSASLSAIACIVFAGILILHDKSGWGWFLFCAVLFHAVYKCKE